jgi:ATP-dependent Lon protease
MDIPLFPLPNLVLFPRIVVPLHIFEERYKLMINDCIAGGGTFGLVLLQSGAVEEREDTIHRVGVTARIVEVERLAEGRLNILCEGERRFRIHRFTQRIPFWKAFVEFLEESEDDGAESLYDQVADLYRSVANLTARLSDSQEPELVLPESAADLSYIVSYVLDIDFEEKQKLLEIDIPAERLRLLVAHLTAILRRLQQQHSNQEISVKVRGNGDLGMPHRQN